MGDVVFDVGLLLGFILNTLRFAEVLLHVPSAFLEGEFQLFDDFWI